MATREKALAVLEHLPEDRVDAALAALEAVEGRDTSVEAILARHGEERLSPGEFDRHFGSLPSDAEGVVDWLLACPQKGHFVAIDSESTDTL